MRLHGVRLLLWMILGLLVVLTVLQIIRLPYDSSSHSGNIHSPRLQNGRPTYVQHGRISHITADISLSPGLVADASSSYAKTTIMENTTLVEAIKSYKVYITVNQFMCKDVQLNHHRDGSWPMCEVGSFKLRKNCLVYSFGMKDDFSFDKATSQNYDCTMRTFSKRSKMTAHIHGPMEYFYPIGLAAVNNLSGSLCTLGYIMSLLNDAQRVINYLKIDLDHTISEVIQSLIAEKVLPRIKQLAIEAHIEEVGQLRKYMQSIATIEAAGFRVWYTDETNRPDRHQAINCCNTIVFINLSHMNGVPASLPAIAPLRLPTEHVFYTEKGAAPEWMHQPLLSSPRPWQVPNIRPPRLAPVPPVPQTDLRNVQLWEGFSWLNFTLFPVTYSMTTQEAEIAFYTYVETLHIRCKQHVRLGHVQDGGWDLCVQPPYALQEGCLAFSFGINNDWSFDDALTKVYGCEDRAFDPSTKMRKHKRGASIYFDEFGLSDMDETLTNSNKKRNSKWQMKSLLSILTSLHYHKRVIDVLKIDIEYSEWRVLANMLKDGVLQNVKQLVFEFHTNAMYNSITDVPHFIHYWQILNALEMVGFRKWNQHNNIRGMYKSKWTNQTLSCCYELYYMNMNFMNNM